MRISEVSVENLKGVTATLTLEGDVTLLVGKNGTGKSTLLDALVLVSELAQETNFANPTARRSGSDALSSTGGGFVISVVLETDPDEVLQILASLGTQPGVWRFVYRVLLAQDRIHEESLDAVSPSRSQGLVYAVARGFNLDLEQWDEDPANSAPTKRIASVQQSFLALEGQLPGAVGEVVSAIRQQFSRIRFVQAVRWSRSAGHLRGDPALSADASNLIPILARHTLRGTGSPIETAKGLMPGIEGISLETGTSQDPPAISLKVRERGVGSRTLDIPWEHVSDGYKQAIILSSFIHSSPRGSTLLIEEPELSFHSDVLSRLPRVLLNLSQELGVQFVISTHSPVLVDELELGKVRVLTKGDDGVSHCRSLSEFTGAARKLEEGGILKRWLTFRSERRLRRASGLMIVDGADDKDVWHELLHRHYPDLFKRVTIVHGTGEQEGLAMAQLLRTVNDLGVTSLPFILVRDSDGDQKGKEEATLKAGLGVGDFHVLEEKELDSYLCNASAIAKAFNHPEAIGEIEGMLSKRGKEQLEKVCSRFAPAGRSDPATKAQIAGFIPIDDLGELATVIAKLELILSR